MDKSVKISGLDVAYSDEESFNSSGQTLVFLHGWGCDRSIFKRYEQVLSLSFRVIRVDLPGFGDTPEPPEVWGIEKYTKLIESFVKVLDLKNIVIVGHSFGGRIAILYSSRNAGVDKVILLDAAGVKPKRTYSYYCRVYSFKLLKNVINFLLPKKYATKVLDAYTGSVSSEDYKNSSKVMRGVLSRVVNEDLCFCMPMIKYPTLLIWGVNDTATPLSDAEKMNELIPDSGLVRIQDAGHFAFLEKAGEVDIVIKNFLNSKNSSKNNK